MSPEANTAAGPEFSWSRDDAAATGSAWRCPSCATIIDYHDYDTALSGERFKCRGCNILLIVKHGADRVVAAEPPGKIPGTGNVNALTEDK